MPFEACSPRAALPTPRLEVTDAPSFLDPPGTPRDAVRASDRRSGRVPAVQEARRLGEAGTPRAERPAAAPAVDAADDPARHGRASADDPHADAHRADDAEPDAGRA